MKLISKVAVLFLMVFNLLSCSKDDEQKTLEGKWEFYKNGYFYNTPEVENDYVLYKNACTSKKDYRFFSKNSNGTLQDFYFSSDCNETSRTYIWTLKDNGKKLDINYKDGTGDIYEIVLLNGTTLKLKYLESYGIINNKGVKRASHLILRRVK